MERRKRRSAAEWSSLVTQWQASGLSTRAFAARHGLSAATLYWWRQRLASSPSASGRSSTGSFSAKSNALVTFAEVRVSEPADTKCQLEVVARSGHVIRVRGVVDPFALRALLAAVERC